MNREKILWLCSWYPDRNEPYNGDFVQRHARAAALYNDIYVIHLAADNKKNEERINETITPGLTEKIVYFQPAKGWLNRWRNYYRWSRAYKNAIKEYFRTHNKPGLVHVHVPMRDGLMAMRLKRMFGIPYLVTEHWTIYQPQNKKRYEEQTQVLRSLIYWIIRKSSLLLPVSKDLGVLINKLVTPKEYMVVENVANTDYFYYKNHQRTETGFRFLHVSNFAYQKNAEPIIESFILLLKSSPNAELVLVGPVTAEVQEKISGSGLLNKNIFLKGEISYPEVAKQMQEADSLVLFSRYENSPCTIIEALCCGLPVIATTVGGIPELIDGSNGLLVEPGDLQDLVSAMEKMISDFSSFDRASISSIAMNRFSYPVVGKKLDEIYSAQIKRID